CGTVFSLLFAFVITMSGKFLDGVKKLVRESRMLSPAILALIEVGLEKILEIEFSCPCVPKLNAGYSVCVFMIPALVVLFLMLSQKWTGIKDCYKRFLIALVPTVAWLIITFLDGRYFVCSQAYGTGSFNVSLHTEGLAQSCNMKDEAMTEKETLDLIKKYTATSQVRKIY
ncbi:calcium homeostasis modulator protein 6-like isoform X1, partial [Huso huso]